MGMLFDLLPLLDAWEYRIIDEDDITIPAGGTYDLIFAEKEIGWIMAAALTLHGPNAEKSEISYRVDNWEFQHTIEELYNVGVVQRGVMTPYITRYDTVLNIFEYLFEFAYPMPYKSFLRVSIRGPTENAITIGGVVGTIRIKTEPTVKAMKEKFEKSLRQVLGVEDILKEMRKGGT